MEKFLPAILDSSNTEWGTEVRKRVSEYHESEGQNEDEPVARPDGNAIDQPSLCWTIQSIFWPFIQLVSRKPAPHHPTPHATIHSPVPLAHPPNVHPYSTTSHIQGENVVYKLSTRVARSVEVLKIRYWVSNDDLLVWQKCKRVCQWIEAAASLVCCANAKLAWFGGTSKLLGDIGSSEGIRKLSQARTDELFVIHWTCLSLVAIRYNLETSQSVQGLVGEAIVRIAGGDDTGNDDALAGAQKSTRGENQ